MRNSFFLIVLFTFVFSNCNSGKKDKDVFEGYFSYLADANMFVSCDESVKVSVEMKDAYLELEKKYLSVSDGNGGKVYVKLRGKIQKVQAMEGDKMIDGLVILEVVEMDANKKCE